MNEALLADHVGRLCVKNLRSKVVKCCARCPFEEEIVAHRPELAGLFEAKRKLMAQRAPAVAWE